MELNKGTPKKTRREIIHNCLSWLFILSLCTAFVELIALGFAPEKHAHAYAMSAAAIVAVILGIVTHSMDE